MEMSAAIWIAIATGIVTVIAVLRVFRAKSTARKLDVGSVSKQWVAEHRIGSRNRDKSTPLKLRGAAR
jgi:hypothetical protein